MNPTIGRIVHYTLDASDVQRVSNTRQSLAGVIGAPQGNFPTVGDVYPMLITRVWDYGTPNPDAMVNGQVFLDGNDCLWVTSVKAGEGPHTFAWPGRA
jgi:hypothetical protein